MKEQRRTLNTQQAADYIGCSRSLVFKMLEDGRLQGYKIGLARGIRVYVDSIEKLIADREI